jgi:hypothetical protein
MIMQVNKNNQETLFMPLSIVSFLKLQTRWDGENHMGGVALLLDAEHGTGHAYLRVGEDVYQAFIFEKLFYYPVRFAEI